jgi:hypothetical protein
MRSPIVAILWEHWRLTRVEAAGRLAFVLVLGSAVLASSSSDAGALGFMVLASQYAVFWVSIARLNGGRFLDGYRPGFPLHLLYVRPIPTVMFVGVAMAYDAVSCTALYLASAALLGFVFGKPLPLLSVAVWIVAFHAVSTAIQWASRSRVVQWLGSFGLLLPLFALLRYRTDVSPLQVEFSLVENALMAAIGLVAFGLTVAGVSRQRRGEAPEAKPRTSAPAAVPDWLINLFRFPCPTSSATRAQIWFDLKSSGLPVLAIGVALAILIPLLFVVTTQLDVVLSGFYTRPATRTFAVVVAVFSLPAVLILGGNAFGIRARQGVRYASVFALTQASGTARIAGLKVLVRSVCLLAALVAVGTSVWASASVIPFDVLEDNDTLIEKSRWPLSGSMRAIEGALGAMSAYELVALAIVTAIVVVVMVASRAALAALRVRYSRRVHVALSLLLLHGLLLVLVAIAERRVGGPAFLLNRLLEATGWIAGGAIAFVTVYLFWRAFAEQLMTLRQSFGAFLIAVVFGAAWVTVLRVAGVQFAGMPMRDAVGMLWPVLLPLIGAVLAPWSLSRVRHT